MSWQMSVKVTVNLYVLHCEHKHGVDVHIYKSEAEVEEAIAEWRDDWGEDAHWDWDVHAVELEVAK